MSNRVRMCWSLQAKMQKEEITRIMENTKRNQKKAAKLIQKVMSYFGTSCLPYP